MIQYTTVYEVWGSEEEQLILNALFIDLKTACKYAVANRGKIHPQLPEVVKRTYIYDSIKQVITQAQEKIEPAQIYYMDNI